MSLKEVHLSIPRWWFHSCCSIESIELNRVQLEPAVYPLEYYVVPLYRVFLFRDANNRATAPIRPSEAVWLSVVGRQQS